MADILESSVNLKPLSRPRIYWVFSDTIQLIKRSLLHIKQDPDQLLGVTIQPIMFIVLFRYVFGGAINTGGISYVNFLMAGIFVQTAAFGSTTTSISIASDLKEGIVDRFRSLPMVKSAVVSGHIFADMIRSLLATAVMIAAGLAVGFRPHAGVGGWAAAIGMLLLLTFALSWVAAIIGLLGKSVEFVQQVSFIWLFPLTFASSAFVPTSSMPKGLRAFAVNQPITQVVDAVRSLLLNLPLGNHVWVSLIWLVGIIVVAIPITAYSFKRRNTE
jgi:ABC-2 type transport system permease protein